MGSTGRRMFAATMAGTVGALMLTGCGLGRGIGKDPAEKAVDDATVDGTVSSVRFDSSAGAVKIRVDTAARSASVHRNLEYGGSKPGASHRMDGDTLVLSGCGDQCSVDYEVVLPKAVPVSGKVNSGGIDISGTKGADVTAQSGKVSISDVDGPTKVESRSGNVDVSLTKPNDVKVDASAGFVSVAVPSAPYQVKVKVDTGKTDVSVPNTDGAPHTIDVHTNAGSAEVKTA